MSYIPYITPLCKILNSKELNKLINRNVSIDIINIISDYIKPLCVITNDFTMSTFDISDDIIGGIYTGIYGKKIVIFPKRITLLDCVFLLNNIRISPNNLLIHLNLTNERVKEYTIVIKTCLARRLYNVEINLHPLHSLGYVLQWGSLRIHTLHLQGYKCKNCDIDRFIKYDSIHSNLLVPPQSLDRLLLDTYTVTALHDWS